MSAPETEKPWIIGNWKIWQDAPEYDMRAHFLGASAA